MLHKGLVVDFFLPGAFLERRIEDFFFDLRMDVQGGADPVLPERLSFPTASAFSNSSNQPST